MNETAKKLSESLDEASSTVNRNKHREAKRKRKKEEKKAKKSKKKKRRIELGPPPETKIDLSKLEQDIIQLAEDAASSGKFENWFLFPQLIFIVKILLKDKS